LSVFLNTWGFSDAVRKFAPKAFLTDPIGTLLGIRFKPIAARISEEGKKKGRRSF